MRRLVVLGYQFEPVDITILLTLILLEGVLSFDNAAIIAAMVRKLPEHQRRKALFYGVGGAYVLRLGAILSVSFIVQYPILKLIGGLYLLYLAFKHLRPKDPHATHVEHSILTRFGMSGFWAVVIAVEVADLVFAIDQVLVAVAMTEKTLLIVIASFAAILLLRLSATYIGRLMDWFPALERLAYLAVGFVGAKLVLVEVLHRLGHVHFEVPKIISIGVTLTLLVVPVAVKYLYDRFARPAV